MAYISLNLLFRQRLFLLIALLFFQFNAIAQNLVPNPSFEEHDGCPNTFFNLSYVNDWFPINGSPDYFNRCSNHGFGIPYNVEGMQETFLQNGDAYIGEAFNIYQMNQSELICVQLLQPLIIGRQYFFSMNASPENNYNNRPGCFCNKIGFNLSTFKPDESNGNVLWSLNFSSTTFAYDSIIDDTTIWYNIKSAIIADSAYRYISIGVFYPKDSLNWLCRDSQSYYTYTYIDDVCVSLDSTICYTKNKELPTSLFTVSYSNGELIVAGGRDYEMVNVTCYSILGQIIFHYSGTERRWVRNFAKGIYIVIINNEKLLFTHF